MTTKYIVNNVTGQTINGESILPKYKVYTALLTQSGGTNQQSITDTSVTQGVSYYFLLIPFPDPQSYDFSNIGGPKYPEQFPFVATSSDAPNDWGGYSLFYNEGAPVVTVLENTIGNIWFTYNSIGYYYINQDFNFIPEKTFVILTNNTTGDVTLGNNMAIGFELYQNSSTIIIDTTTNGTETDGVLFNTPIEIRVYN